MAHKYQARPYKIQSPWRPSAQDLYTPGFMRVLRTSAMSWATTKLLIMQSIIIYRVQQKSPDTMQDVLTAVTSDFCCTLHFDRRRCRYMTPRKPTQAPAHFYKHVRSVGNVVIARLLRTYDILTLPISWHNFVVIYLYAACRRFDSRPGCRIYSQVQPFSLVSALESWNSALTCAAISHFHVILVLIISYPQRMIKCN